MARPRKMNTDDMLAIVNTVYEETGDPSRLKYSFLAECAVTQGFDVKPYDFRRTKEVRVRIEELRDLSPFFTKGNSLAYKDLDVDAFIRRNRNPDSLKTALIELDGVWRRIHERACALLKEKEALSHELKQKSLEFEQLKVEFSETSQQLTVHRCEQRDMLAKNRHLTNMIKKYLHTAIANEILKNEGTLECVDTVVTQTAMDSLVEKDMPLSFSKSISADKQILSREDSLLRQMAANLMEGN